MAILFDPTSEAAADIAQYICGQFKAGQRDGDLAVNGVSFDMGAVSMCSYFVHRSVWAACGHDIPADFGGTARQTEQDMIAQGLRIDQAVRGCCVMFNHGGCAWGHTGVDLGDGLHYAANTCSVKQGGPGYAISTYDIIGRGRISGYYRVLPARGTLSLKVVSNLTGAEVLCKPLLVGQRMTVAAAPLLAAMGLSPRAIPAGVIHEDSLRSYVADLMSHCAGWGYKYEQTDGGPRLYLLPPAA